MEIKVRTTTLYRMMSYEGKYVGRIYHNYSEAINQINKYPDGYVLTEIRGVYVNDHLYVDAECYGVEDR